ncbi:HpcH/HpaI aldolase family protein [Pseudooctadecabacter jejudonensis]|uniref:5-keto-4-deoxy-D-glucarate aldolase n=1 Tax=Pseudooctadecabacter jejudonensis TaxID=1391910 RepID=A0A1Y5RPX8_9RHOB|nr:aldolase/citrate lyase family protein [Pseudooctadecabacter jejudonensis]SLN22327.1 5-keto-4-deoxy-D-glucarate aldolase [Pseudooctadecabacter jejudonensis]
MRTAGLRARVLGRERLASTFVKTAEVTVVEVLATSGLDFIVLDGEHSGFDRGRLDACLAVARALDFPAMVRISSASEENVLMALDAGAVGVVVPHVDSVAKAQAVARAAHFGRGGRGFAGSTRWAGFATRPMGEVLDQDGQTIVMAQIEEPEGVEACEGIAAIDGIDALFAGPADLTVGYGHRDTDNDDLRAALVRVGQACQQAGKGYVSWVPDAAKAAEWSDCGMTGYVVASEHTWMRQGAAMAAKGIHALG